ncbi:MAG: AraC family transcriptional regulator [Verrucomicrobiales bacterium]|nr:AraC family transcriptional regulator [Verrucomicrobiales bacterium]
MPCSSPSPLQSALIREIGGHAGFPALFDNLDRVAFFLKNRDFQIVFANRFFYERLGFTEESEIIGKDDLELFPKPLATKFREDDKRVLETGESMPRMVELFLSRQGLPDWFITNKMPVIGLNGDTVGIMGTVQRYDQARSLRSPDRAIAKAVQLMLERPGEIESLARLAKELGLSHRHFDRRFKEDTGLTPKQFLGRSRVQSGCKLLQNTDASISDIALDLGYCDQSAFTSQFRTRMGFTPAKYRRQMRSNAEAVV